MAGAAADQNLLLGILALQMNFVSRDQLIAAMHTWVLDKHKGIGPILAEQGALATSRLSLLEAMVREHLAAHGNSTERSLAALGTPASIQDLVGQVKDPEIEGTLRGLARHPADGEATSTIGYVVGAPADHGARFQILRPHARGALGMVSVALDAEVHREVALKEIQPQFADDPVSRARFVLEAEVTGRLEHPGIVPVYGLGTNPQGQPYYAMRFVRGQTLKEALDDFHRADADPKRDLGERALSLRKLLSRFIDACHAMEYAHSRGVLHRDIKPSNILLGPYGETLVVDWGLAKVVGLKEDRSRPSAEATLRPASGSGSTETQAGSAVGTPAYMSPEQAEGRLGDMGPASDIYSLGATLFALLTGKPPLEDADILTILRRAQRGDVPAPAAVNPRVPLALDAVVRKAMALRPQDRYASARGLAEEIERWLADEPVQAYPEPFSLRSRRWMRQHRTLVWAGVATLLVSLAGLTAVLVVQGRANQDLKLANSALLVANGREQRARTQAQGRFDLAMEAVKAYYSGVSEDVLLKEPQMEELRRKLLTTALDFYRRLQNQLESEGAADPRAQRDLEDAAFRIGQINESIGSENEALRAFQQALNLTRKRTGDRPADASDRLELARRHDALGLVLLRIGRHPEAQSHVDEAHAVLQQSLRDSPPDLDSRSELAENRYLQADLLMESGKPEEAFKADRSSIDILEGLVKDHPGQTALRERLVMAMNLLGHHSVFGPRPADALPVLERGLEIAERLAAENPDQPRYLRLLGLLLTNKGNLQGELRNDSEAIKDEKLARDHQERLVRERPTSTRYRADLAATYHNIGLSQVNLGEWESALENFKRTSAILEALIRENPSVVLFRRDQCSLANSTGYALSSHARKREAIPYYQAAIEGYQSLIREFPANSDYQFRLARTLNNYGNVTLELGESERAVEAFRQGRDLLERVVNETRNAFHRYEYAASVSNFAHALDDRDDREAALTEYQKGIALLGEVARESPAVGRYRSDLAQIEGLMGNLLLRMNRISESVAPISRALELREALVKEQPEDEYYRSELAVGLIQVARLRILQGKDGEALDGLKRAGAILDGLKKRKDTALYNRACLLAQEGAALTAPGRGPSDEAEGKRRFDAAIDALREAIAEGFSDQSSLRRDLDLEPIRGRGDFQALLADLNFPAAPFAP